VATAISLTEFKAAIYLSYLDMVAIPTAEAALLDPAHPLHAHAAAALERFRAEREEIATRKDKPHG
jgi:hypothetical protein